MPKMRTSFQGLVRLLAKSLYPEPDVFVRELLQNAHDSIQLRRVHAPEPAGEIRIDADESGRTLSFSDNGTGMDRRDIEEFLSVIGSTGTGSRARELAARDVAVATIGQFGIGLLSAFVVAERIEVHTRKPMAPHAWRWVNRGGEEYELDTLPASAQSPGTRVIVTLAADRTAFLDGRLIRQTVRRYADFLPFPILLNGFGPINAVNAPWHEPGWRDPIERERSLSAFLSQRYADPPLMVIPVDFPSPRASGGLFIPARYTPGGQTGGTVDVFQARMCIRPNDSELLPEWARFVRGVVDCPELHPTAARDNVLRDEVYHALREALGGLIVTALFDLAARDRPRFLQLCDWHHDAIKGMAARHPEFGAAVLDHLPFETNQGQLTLPDYLDRQATDRRQAAALFLYPRSRRQPVLRALSGARSAVDQRRAALRRNPVAPLRRPAFGDGGAQTAGSAGRSELVRAAGRGGTGRIRPPGTSDGPGVGGTGGTGKNPGAPLSAGQSERDSAGRPARLRFRSNGKGAGKTVSVGRVGRIGRRRARPAAPAAVGFFSQRRTSAGPTLARSGRTRRSPLSPAPGRPLPRRAAQRPAPADPRRRPPLPRRFAGIAGRLSGIAASARTLMRPPTARPRVRR
ncbi:MAG: ATP-binding protein [Candidatus Competibacter sp.]